MSNFLGSIKRGTVIPISLSLDTAATGTPTFRILNSARAEVVVATNLSGSGLLYYYTTQTVGTSDAEGEYTIEYSAVIAGDTLTDIDTYEVPSASAAATGTALSGSSDWTLTRDKIIKQALQIPGVIAEDADPSAVQLALVSDILNQYVKRLQVKHNVKLWTLEWDYKKFSAASQVTGDDSNIYTCILGHNAAAANKPITGDDWTSYWVKKGTTGGVWALLTAYSSSGDFTETTDIIAIEQAFLRKTGTSSHNDTKVEIIGNAEHARLPNKTYFGDPTRLYFDNKISPTIFVTPMVDDTDDTVLHYQKILRIQDFDAAGDTPDFPVEWIDHLVWKMAHKMSIFYHIPIQDQREIKREADEALNDVLFPTTNRAQRLRISPRITRR